MGRKELLEKGEKAIADEQNIMKMILECFYVRDSLDIFLRSLGQVSKITNDIINDFMKNDYGPVPSATPFTSVISSCTDYQEIMKVDEENDPFNILANSPSKIAFVFQYNYFRELMNLTCWYLERNQGKINIHNFVDKFFTTKDGRLAFRNYFLQNDIHLEVSDDEVYFDKNYEFLLYFAKMQITHLMTLYIFHLLKLLEKENRIDDESLVLMRINIANAIISSSSYGFNDEIISCVQEKLNSCLGVFHKMDISFETKRIITYRFNELVNDALVMVKTYNQDHKEKEFIRK